MGHRVAWMVAFYLKRTISGIADRSPHIEYFSPLRHAFISRKPIELHAVDKVDDYLLDLGQSKPMLKAHPAY
jgi:hypothetical protein